MPPATEFLNFMVFHSKRLTSRSIIIEERYAISLAQRLQPFENHQFSQIAIPKLCWIDCSRYTRYYQCVEAIFYTQFSVQLLGSHFDDENREKKKCIVNGLQQQQHTSNSLQSMRSIYHTYSSKEQMASKIELATKWILFYWFSFSLHGNGWKTNCAMSNGSNKQNIYGKCKHKELKTVR